MSDTDDNFKRGMAEGIALFQLAAKHGFELVVPEYFKGASKPLEDVAPTYAAHLEKLANSEPAPKEEEKAASPPERDERGMLRDWRDTALVIAEKLGTGKEILAPRLVRDALGIPYHRASRGDLVRLSNYMIRVCGLQWSQRSHNGRCIAVYTKPAVAMAAE